MSDGRQLRSSSSNPPEPSDSSAATTGCICGKKLTKTSKKIKCKNCNRVCHADCVALNGLSPTSLSALTMWVCPPCLVFQSGYFTIDSLPPALVADLVTVISAQIQSAGILSQNSNTVDTNTVETNTDPTMSYSEALISPTTPIPTGENNIESPRGEVHAGDAENQWQEVRARKPANPHPPTVTNPDSPEVQRIVVSCENTKTTISEIRQVLRDIPARAIERERRIVLLFEKKEHKDAAAGLLRVSLNNSKVHTKSGVKVTVFNVPVPEDLENEQAVEYLTEGLARKNGDLLKSSDFEIVFTKRHVRRPGLMNIRLRVSPDLRESLVKRGNVNFDLTRCRVEPHAFFRQCYHCQRPGHSQDCCPSSQDPATCMYCGKAHRSDSCPTKDQQNTHKCSNCKSTSHHAGYQGCPVLQKHKMEEVAKNQLRSMSK